jgi:hypothetical protein
LIGGALPHHNLATIILDQVQIHLVNAKVRHDAVNEIVDRDSVS